MSPDQTAVTTRLVHTHQELITWLETRLGSRALADEILSDAFGRPRRNNDDLIDDESIVAWCVRVLRDGVVRRRHREVNNMRLAAIATELDGGTAPPELRRAIFHGIARLAKNLHPGYARVLQRVDLDGLSIPSYAAEAAIRNHNLVVVQVFLAREAMREQVRQCCKAASTPPANTCS